MKYFNKKVWFVLALDLLLLIFVAVFFKVDDMTLSKGEVITFNEDWTLTWPEGESLLIEELPYLGKSEPGEVLILEKTIPQQYFGKTMAFLSADKQFKVWMDDVLVYEFGVEDKRVFGHTPGSVYNFIDIPHNLTEGKLRMEMVSPYADYGARVSKVDIGERDVLILQLLEDNIIQISCNILILICGIVFLLLFLIQLMSKQDTGGMQYLFGYCMVTSLYYFVETKVLHIFYGNQTFYSVLVFLCVMMIPYFIALYYANGKLGIYKKRWTILLGLICLNITVQLILQLLNLVDFMNMAFASHGLIALTVFVVAKSYVDSMKEKKEKSTLIGMIALLFMGIGGTIDIVRMYVVAVGDMGKFSRMGTVCFALIMLFQHFSMVIKSYTTNIEENARLWKNEKELMEKKNKQLEEANALAEEARQEALAANAAKGKFLAHMSHEIRTPINAVLGMDTMILRETKDMQIKEYALDIQNAGQSLLSLINDILDFSKIESEKLEIIPVEYDMSSLIHDISNMIKAKAEAKKLELVIHVDETLPSKLLGDDVRIRQVLVNLLNNAVKYTQSGRVTLSVSGRVAGRKAILDCSVSDTGIGIKGEDIEKLFKEFERIEERRNRNIEGTGLGINITTQLLLLMGSRLQVESEYGKGSRFYFTLEQQIVDSTPIGNLEERIRKQSKEYTYTSTFTAPEADILVVDDNLINLKVFVNLLKRTQLNVDVADSGKECLQLACKKHYDLIFLDHMMPEMDGIETFHHMKEMETSLCGNTPVIALTANAITGAKEMYLAEGFDAFLPKPVNPVKLEQLILKLLPRDLLHFDVEEESEESTADTNKGHQRPASVEINLPVVEGIDWSYGLMHLTEQELLINMVSDFYKIIESEADKLDGFYDKIHVDANMVVQYRIKVHSMKSTANLIGATVIGGMAKFLEDAARHGELAVLETLHPIFIKEWRSYKEKLTECMQMICKHDTASEKKKPADKTEIFSYLKVLKEAAEEMDIDVMDENIEKLQSYQYPDEMQSQIDKLSVLVTNMEVDEIVDLIELMLGQ